MSCHYAHSSTSLSSFKICTPPSQGRMCGYLIPVRATSIPTQVQPARTSLYFLWFSSWILQSKGSASQSGIVVDHGTSMLGMKSDKDLLWGAKILESVIKVIYLKPILAFKNIYFFSANRFQTWLTNPSNVSFHAISIPSTPKEIFVCSEAKIRVGRGQLKYTQFP